MAIKDLFQNDIYRTINGVVYADKLDHDIVWQELDEYVVTKELLQHINRLFKTYGESLSKLDSSGNNGVWISGFFGSGKSHFLKILSYLFENRQLTQDDVKRTALEFFKDKISDPMAFAAIEEAIKSPTEVILFNIDSLSFQNDEKGATLKAFFGVFNRKRGFCFSYPHVAHVEQFLTRKGVYKEYISAFDEISGSSWYKEREDYVFYTDDIVKAIVQVLPNQAENGQLLDWITHGEKSYPLTIENFAGLVAEYIEEKGRRILFMADEMGQFIGSHSDRMLNLQTIVENLGTKTKGKAWVFVTSQEDIDSVLGGKIQNKGNDFSKIQARFHTRLSLSSSSIAEVIQKRLLRKRPEILKELTEIYTTKKDILLNQLSFSTDSPSMLPFQSVEDFTASYPFVSYQFNLVQDIFDAIRAVGATGLNLSKGERSMLDAFQTALKVIGERANGSLVPLYAFFPTVQSFLDGSVARSLYNAQEIPGLTEADLRLLETLFLIRYLKLRRIRGTPHNLSVLIVSEVDGDMVRLKRGVEESLARLEKENLISRQGDEFIFLTIEEQSISREIQNTVLQGNKDIRELALFLFQDDFDGKAKYRHENGKTFDIQLSLDGFNQTNKGDFLVELVSPLSGDVYQSKRSSGIMTSAAGNQILVVLPEVPEYYRELTLYLKTKTYMENRGKREASPGEETIIAQKTLENNHRRNNLITKAGDLVQHSSVYIVGVEYKTSSKHGSAFLMEVSKQLVDTLYKKLSLLPNPAGDWENMVKSTLTFTSSMIFGEGFQTNNPLALEEVRTYLELSSLAAKTLTIADFVKRFGAVPYGWPEGNAQVLLATLFKMDEIKLFKGAYLEPMKAQEYFLKPSLYDGVSVSRSKVVGEDVLQAAQQLANELFMNFTPSNSRELAEQIRKVFKEWEANLTNHLRTTEHDPEAYPGVADMKQIRELIKPLQSQTQNDELIESFAGKAVELKTAGAQYNLVNEFFKSQVSLWRQAQKIREQIKPNQERLVLLEGVSKALEKVETILHSPQPYNQIKDLSPELKFLQDSLEEIIKIARTGLLEKVNRFRDDLTPLCEEIGLTPEQSYQVKVKLNLLEKQSQTERNLAQLDLLTQTMAEKAYDDAIVVLQAFRTAKIPKPPVKATDSNFNQPSVGRQVESVPTPAPLRVEVIKLVDILAKKEIRTPQDVDLVVDAIKAALRSRLAQGKVVRLE